MPVFEKKLYCAYNSVITCLFKTPNEMFSTSKIFEYNNILRNLKFCFV
jgi:hypothetical protein